MRGHLRRWYDARGGFHPDQFPPGLRRGLVLLARLIGPLVLIWMLYTTYRQREALLGALQFDPLYFLPIALFYLFGFALAVVNWRKLLAFSGVQHTFAKDYGVYALMAACRYVPIPYTHFASLFYFYQQLGTGYRSTGLTVVLQSLLHIVVGILLACAMVLAGVTFQYQAATLVVLGVGALTCVGVHPAVFNRILRFRSSPAEYEHIPRLGWRTMLFLIGLNTVLVLAGGIFMFLCARAVFAAPLLLLPVFIAAWSLMVSANNLLAWSPSSFGIANIVLLAVLHDYLSVALITATLAMFRVSMVVLDLLNAGVGLLLLKQKDGDI